MIFNPSSNVFDALGNRVLGGKHFVYIMAHTEAKYQNTASPKYDSPAYDAGKNFIQVFKMTGNPNLVKLAKAHQYSNAMWVTIPLKVPSTKWLGCDATVKLRVGKPYRKYFSFANGTSMADSHNDNNFYPSYNFSTSEVSTVTDDAGSGLENHTGSISRLPMVPLWLIAITTTIFTRRIISAQAKFQQLPTMQ